MSFVFWLPALCSALHVSEEFFWPGHFSEWFRAYRPENRLSFTRGFAIAINGLMLAVAGVLGWMGPEWSRGLSMWLILATILGANAFLHIIGTWRTRRYSPGLITGVLLNLPLCVWGFWHFLGNGDASFQLAATSLVLGVSFDFWSNLSHRARSGLVERNA